MGTRARVGLVLRSGSVRSIYTHWDGYPSHHGPLLLGHYNTVEKVKALLALGDLSSLGRELGQKHDFHAQVDKGWCTAFKRDRNEPHCEAITSPNEDSFLRTCDDCGAEYAYVFSAGRWACSKVDGDGGFKWEELDHMNLEDV